MSPPAAWTCNNKEKIKVEFKPEDAWRLDPDERTQDYGLNKCNVTGKDSRATLITELKAAHWHGVASEKTGIWGCQLDDQPVQWFDGTDTPIGATLLLCSIAGLSDGEHKIAVTTGTTDDGSELGLAMINFAGYMSGARPGDGKTFESDGAPAKSGAPDRPKEQTTPTSSTTRTGDKITDRTRTETGTLKSMSSLQKTGTGTSDASPTTGISTQASSTDSALSTNESLASSPSTDAAMESSTSSTDTSSSSTVGGLPTSTVIALGVLGFVIIAAIIIVLVFARRKSGSKPSRADYSSVDDDSNSDSDLEKHRRRR